MDNTVRPDKTIAARIAGGRYKKALDELNASGLGGPDADLLRGKALRGMGRHKKAVDVSDNIDVLVDGMGFTRDNRQEIFARRPAPVQVTWLGYPGTTGADYFDYIITDPVVTPEGSGPFFSEHLCRLPETYFVNDKDRAVANNPILQPARPGDR